MKHVHQNVVIKNMSSTIKYYYVKEIYLTIQGEGYHQGKVAVFCRFSGCNLWDGKEQSRENSVCQFCDTDFIGIDGLNGGKYSEIDLVDKIVSLWQDQYNQPFIVFTGGEPALQITESLVSELKDAGFYVAIETNGTRNLPSNIDWISCSPKTKSIALTQVDELKVVYPDINPQYYYDFNAKHFWIQPNAQDPSAIEKSLGFCLNHSNWRLSIQTHKLFNIR